jgi:hypothetical protein
MTCQRKFPSLASLVTSLIAVSLTLGAGAAQAASPAVDEHGHGTAASQTETSPKAQPKALSDSDALMQKMQDMHERMMAAKTPEERAKLMDEQMPAMQQGMAMMNAMRHPHGGMGSNGMRHDMMEKRMDMMQMMMTMMMDRQSIESAPTAK